jgi:hypothetical protein
MKRYKITRADRAGRHVEVGEIVYPGHDTYGCANDDSRSEGMEYIAVSLQESGIPFFTIPKSDVHEIK